MFFRPPLPRCARLPALYLAACSARARRAPGRAAPQNILPPAHTTACAHIVCNVHYYRGAPGKKFMQCAPRLELRRAVPPRIYCPAHAYYDPPPRPAYAVLRREHRAPRRVPSRHKLSCGRPGGRELRLQTVPGARGRGSGQKNLCSAPVARPGGIPSRKCRPARSLNVPRVCCVPCVLWLFLRA